MMPSSPTSQSSKLGESLTDSAPIVFFDGECVMCSGLVDFLLQIDRDGIFRLTPLQGQTAAKLLPPLPTQREAWSIYYLEQGRLYSQSDAVLQIFQKLGGVWAGIGMAQVLPGSFRDRLYRTIARNRYHWFGRRATCRMPTEVERDRFLP